MLHIPSHLLISHLNETHLDVFSDLLPRRMFHHTLNTGEGFGPGGCSGGLSGFSSSESSGHTESTCKVSLLCECAGEFVTNNADWISSHTECIQTASPAHQLLKHQLVSLFHLASLLKLLEIKERKILCKIKLLIIKNTRNLQRKNAWMANFLGLKFLTYFHEFACERGGNWDARTPWSIQGSCVVSLLSELPDVSSSLLGYKSSYCTQSTGKTALLCVF